MNSLIQVTFFIDILPELLDATHRSVLCHRYVQEYQQHVDEQCDKEAEPFNDQDKLPPGLAVPSRGQGRRHGVRDTLLVADQVLAATLRVVQQKEATSSVVRYVRHRRDDPAGRRDLRSVDFSEDRREDHREGGEDQRVAVEEHCKGQTKVSVAQQFVEVSW